MGVERVKQGIQHTALWGASVDGDDGGGFSTNTHLLRSVGKEIQYPVTASLECTFSTSSTDYDVYWYRQYPGTAPEFILYSGENSYTAEFARQRFSSEVTDGRAPLSISNVRLGDSAVYYCALDTTVIH
uniref:Ig-like domain-containing protein n=1 Tax=Paramormyrops kingsleyae TaxID=1676925 RepID=A0A3B3Q313_9TELE